MKFEDFIRQGQAKKSSNDVELARSLVNTACEDLEFLETLQINEKSARKIMVNYYDVLRSVLEAISALEGYKIYSHEAFTYFLKEKGEEIFSTKFDRFRKIRNRINYYGQAISVEETSEYIKEISKMVKILIGKYLSETK